MRRSAINRLVTILSAAAVAAAMMVHPAAGEDRAAVVPKLEEGLAWYDVSSWPIEGKGWCDTARPFDRLPARAEGVVRGPVWGLSRHSAGMCTRFETDASAISVRYTLLSDRVAMSHMPATGVSGVDLYARDDDGQWRWVAVTRPTTDNVKTELATGLAPGRRQYLLYLPLYNGVESLEIGVAPEAAFKPLGPRPGKPIVYYGTSIAQGACASRPGMAFTSILGRRLARPVINLAFSGNGRMDPEMGDLLAKLDPAVYCIDCLPNMEGPAIAERTEPLVRKLRQAHPDVPIVLIEDRTYTNTRFFPAKRERHTTSRAAFKAAYDRLVADGMQGLVYVEGEHLLGDDGEASTDGSHPSDLGMVRMADALEPVLRPLLEKAK